VKEERESGTLAVVVSVSHLSVARRSANSMSVNPQHAAALALVGWYRMVQLSQSDCIATDDPRLKEN
jgi:hypothetical protein